MYSVQGVQMPLHIGKNILESNKKEVNKRKKQPDGRSYLLLLSIPYLSWKLEMKETKIRSHRFRKVTTAVVIVRFPGEENFPGLH